MKGREGGKDEAGKRGEREGRCTDLSVNTKGKRAQGAACLGAGETLMGGMMITGGTIPVADSTMYLNKISM